MECIYSIHEPRSSTSNFSRGKQTLATYSSSTSRTHTTTLPRNDLQSRPYHGTMQGEKISHLVLQYFATNGIRVEPSPPCAPESNAAAELLVQEHWARARLLMFSSELPTQLRGEALKHANWLRNRLPASRIGGDVPILLWDARTIVDFTKIPPFGQPGFYFIYHPKHAPRKKLLPRSKYSHFVCIDCDNHLLRVYE